MKNCKGIWEITTEREWTNFCLPPEEPIIILVVRGVHVLVTERSICEFYDAPYYYPDYLYKTDLKEFKNVDTEDIPISKYCHMEEAQELKLSTSNGGSTHQ
ncbi:hypothetical protein Golax_000696 [Gossypium laxum]|uniref:Uncharacterized protein n=1 Tax=Gossypium laxum TaxID=34288 RepID=A0A7J9AUJ7_9ROSI|nr:hypothetical protein [Gossypium laxum]